MGQQIAQKASRGFEAVDDVPVHRLEVWEQIRGLARADGPTKNANLVNVEKRNEFLATPDTQEIMA